MKPGAERGSVKLETDQEVRDTQMAVCEFSWVEGTETLLNERLATDAPIELGPAESILALAALKIAAQKWIDEPKPRGRVIVMLQDYEVRLGQQS